MGNQIKIGPRFFEKELQVYSCWTEAFWRELLQNSVDAKASRINIVIDNNDITFSDNGTGMTRQTLENVYFTLGETTKNDETTVGGFGKARILIFAQNNYSLHTQNLLVAGCGADYSITETSEYHDGVRVTVSVKADADTMLAALHRYLELCYLPCKVFINGEQWKRWTYARNHKRDLSFGKVYTNHSQDARLLVRVDGTLMYARHINSPAQVILEIDHAMSRHVLLANRDGLIWKFQRELDSFVQELNINRRSALQKKTNKSTTFRGKGTFNAKRNGEVVRDERGRRVVAKVFAEALDAANEGPAAPVAPRSYHERLSDDYNHEEVRVSLDLFDVKIDDDTDNKLVKRVIDSYDPRNFDLNGSGYRIRDGVRQYFRAGVDKWKLLLLWKTACEKVLEILINHFPQARDNYAWGVGWVFSDFETGEGFRTEARCASENGVKWLLLNPVTDDGKMQYSLSSKDDMLKLIVLATHEVTHFVRSEHDEDFASLYTELSIKVAPHMNAIVAAMKEVKQFANNSQPVCNA